MRESTPHVACIVLSYGSAGDTLDCLASLARSTYRQRSTILLDGDLDDAARRRIAAEHAGVRVVRLTENRGYAGNNNVGISMALAAGADWVFLLNNDTVVDERCVEQLVAGASQAGGAGIVGPMIYHHDQPRTIQSAGGTLSAWWHDGHAGQNEPDRSQYATPRAVDWVSGCSIMVHRRVIESVGSLDERYFMYGEEVEWCLRARRAGTTVLHVPHARVWHKGVRAAYQPTPAVTYYSTRNQLLTLWVHGAPLYVRAARSLEILRTLTSWSVRPKWRPKSAHRDAMWHGAIDYLRGRFGPRPQPGPARHGGTPA